MLPDLFPSPEFIRAKYPKLFSHPIFFECQSGWFPLIEELCSKLEPLLIEKRDQESMYVTQIKEKYGSLRFYMNFYSDEIAEIIEEYQRKSTRICVICAGKGELKCYSCWISTLCDECKRKCRK